MSDKAQIAEDLRKYLDEVKDKIAGEFEKLGLGKDALLRVHGAIDSTNAIIATSGAVPAHDLNDDLAEKPEDHPREQGQGERPPINTDDNVNVASPPGEVEPVISGAPVEGEQKSDQAEGEKSDQADQSNSE